MPHLRGPCDYSTDICEGVHLEEGSVGRLYLSTPLDVNSCSSVLDALIFAGFGFVAFTGLQFGADNVGQGRHQWDVSLAQAQRLALVRDQAESKASGK